MRRNVFYLGIVLLAVGMAVFFLGLPAEIQSQAIAPSASRLSLNALSLGYLPVILNQSGAISLTFNATSQVDFFLANASAYARMGMGASAANASAVALSAEGAGVFEIFQDATYGSFPFIATNVTANTLLYTAGTNVLPGGDYYAVFANVGNATTVVHLEYRTASVSLLQSRLNSIDIVIGVAVVLLAAGFLLVIASFMLQPKGLQQEVMDDAAKRAYDAIDRRGRRRK